MLARHIVYNISCVNQSIDSLEGRQWPRNDLVLPRRSLRVEHLQFDA